MNTIWKIPLPSDDNIVSLPLNARPLTLQLQKGMPCAWFEVDDGLMKHDRKVYIVGTGHPLPEGLTYLGTFQILDGEMVFHAFIE